MSLEVVQMQVGLIENFSEIIGCTETGEAAFVDPAFEVDRMLAEARKRGWRVSKVLLTHGHLDHINGLGEAVDATGATVYCHPLEVSEVLNHVPAQNIKAVEDHEIITLGTGSIEALFTPGHTASCICFYLPAEAALMTGDVLFIGSCGRAQDPVAMKHSLHSVIGCLPEETLIYPGHDYGKYPKGYLAFELAHNPAFAGR